jgi:outer membrane protein OmpA-like peptidoglycan-associated protein
VKRGLFLIFLLPLFAACPQPKSPKPELVTLPSENAFSVMITSVPNNVEILFGDMKAITPTKLKVHSIDQLLLDNIKAVNMPEVVERRIKIYSEKEVEVNLFFDRELSEMAKALNLTKIIVFDYGEGITFDFNKYEIKPNFKPLLAKQADMLKKYFDGIDVYVCGHSDSVGRRDYNLELSLDRAKSVYDELAKLGVPKSSMKIQGFGSDYPLVSNDTEEGRAQNRRIEIILGS